MADFGRGIKAGVAAAAVYLIISVIFEVTGFFYQFGDITMAAGFRISLELTDPSFGIYLILVDIVPRVIRGIVFGAVFAALYNYLPSTTSIVKGVVLSSFLWIVTVIEVIYTTPGWPWTHNGIAFAGTHYGGLVSLSSVGLALAGIISALAFGALTGFLWDRFRAKKLAEARKGNPVLLVGFILGGVLWALSAVAFLIGVVIFGGPIIEESGPAWWYSILFTSVVFLGLPGWVLTLVAWRKTKRGKSGLKFGVAGGVIMALTGHMLLPGVLAITGGVFSGRKPASESGTAAIEQ
jgi:hypothetical protein